MNDPLEPNDELIPVRVKTADGELVAMTGSLKALRANVAANKRAARKLLSAADILAAAKGELTPVDKQCMDAAEAKRARRRTRNIAIAGRQKTMTKGARS